MPPDDLPPHETGISDVVGPDVTPGDRIIDFMPDIDAVVTATAPVAAGGVMLSLDIYQLDGTRVGSTFFIVRPDSVYPVSRP